MMYQSRWIILFVNLRISILRRTEAESKVSELKIFCLYCCLAFGIIFKHFIKSESFPNNRSFRKSSEVNRINDFLKEGFSIHNCLHNPIGYFSVFPHCPACFPIIIIKSNFVENTVCVYYKRVFFRNHKLPLTELMNIPVQIRIPKLWIPDQDNFSCWKKLWTFLSLPTGPFQHCSNPVAL